MRNNLPITQRAFPVPNGITIVTRTDAKGATVALDPALQPLRIQATGHGNRQMCGTDKYGFPIRHRQAIKRHFGFETGDLVRAIVPTGKRKGTHTGRLLCRASGSFDISTNNGRAAGISHRYCRIIQRRDGYAYA